MVRCGGSAGPYLAYECTTQSDRSCHRRSLHVSAEKGKHTHTHHHLGHLSPWSWSTVTHTLKQHTFRNMVQMKHQKLKFSNWNDCYAEKKICHRSKLNQYILIKFEFKGYLGGGANPWRGQWNWRGIKAECFPLASPIRCPAQDCFIHPSTPSTPPHTHTLFILIKFPCIQNDCAKWKLQRNIALYENVSKWNRLQICQSHY